MSEDVGELGSRAWMKCIYIYRAREEAYHPPNPTQPNPIQPTHPPIRTSKRIKHLLPTHLLNHPRRQAEGQDRPHIARSSNHPHRLALLGRWNEASNH